MRELVTHIFCEGIFPVPQAIIVLLLQLVRGTRQGKAQILYETSSSKAFEAQIEFHTVNFMSRAVGMKEVNIVPVAAYFVMTSMVVPFVQKI